MRGGSPQAAPRTPCPAGAVRTPGDLGTQWAGLVCGQKPPTLGFPRGEGGWSPPRVHSELGARGEQWIPAEPEPSPLQGPREEALLPPHPPRPTHTLEAG